MKLDQNTILGHYRGWLQKVAVGLIADPDLQQDLAQEGWIAMWRAFHDFDDTRGALPAWLTSKALWRMRDCARDKAWLGRPPRHQGRVRVLDAVEYPASDTPIWDVLQAADLFDGLELAYHRGEILAAIARLPTAQRWYVYLRFWRGYQHPQLVDTFGYDPHALWSNPRHGAKIKLRQALQRLSL
jgi:DNA-directed RNA polymerase specialized sigma24 family protein